MIFDNYENLEKRNAFYTKGDMILYKNICFYFETPYVKDVVLSKDVFKALCKINKTYLEMFAKEQWKIVFVKNIRAMGCCVYGLFDPQTSTIVVSTKYLNDVVASLYHEIGHFIDLKVLKLSKQKCVKNIIQRERNQINNMLYQELNKEKKSNVKRYKMKNDAIDVCFESCEEVIAEAIAFYYRNCDKFKETCPKLYSIIEKEVDKNIVYNISSSNY